MNRGCSDVAQCMRPWVRHPEEKSLRAWGKSRSPEGRGPQEEVSVREREAGTCQDKGQPGLAVFTAEHPLYPRTGWGFQGSSLQPVSCLCRSPRGRGCPGSDHQMLSLTARRRGSPLHSCTEQKLHFAKENDSGVPWVSSRWKPYLRLCCDV